jgi:hypothetical protein
MKVKILQQRSIISSANAQQTKVTQNHKNAKEKILKASAAIWFNDNDTLLHQMLCVNSHPEDGY